MRFGFSMRWKRNSHTKYKRELVYLAAFFLSVHCFFFAVSEEAETAGDMPLSESMNLLVIYPREADRRNQEDTLSAVGQVLLSLQMKADYTEWHAANRLDQYSHIIWCDTSDTSPMDTGILEGYSGNILALGRDPARDEQNGSASTPDKLTIGKADYHFPEGGTFSASVPLLSPARFADADYTSGTLETAGEYYPLICGKDNIRCISIVDYTTEFAKAVLTQEISQWLWPYDSRMHTYTEYVVLDHVYPFTDPYRLQRIVQYLAEMKMAFVISVMPIYEHADYPAMETFCEVLRYAQRNGGCIILCSPLIQGTPDAESLKDKLTAASINYMDHGVYPLALEIPCEWIFREDLRTILQWYRTLFIQDMHAMAAYPTDSYGLQAYFDMGVQQITPALKMNETGVSQIARCATAVYIDFSATEDDWILATINAVKNSPIPVQDLWGLPASVFLGKEHVLSWDQNTLLIDGKQHFRTEDRKKTEEPFDYKRNVYYRVIADLSHENYLLIGMSMILLAIFICLGLSSRRQMRRRFLISRFPQDTDQKKKEDQDADS